eukprot:EG_transcript_7576
MAAEEVVADDDLKEEIPAPPRLSLKESFTSFHSSRTSSLTSARPNYELCVSFGAVQGSWTALKFKKPRQKDSESKLPDLPQITKRYCPPSLTSSSLVSLKSNNQWHLCLFGGILDNNPVNETWLYDLESKRWTAVQEGKDDEGDASPQAMQRKKLRAQKGYSALFPHPRCGHNAVPIRGNSEMLLFGGANISTAAYYNDVWSFDPDLHEWKSVATSGTAPEPRWQSTAVTIEDRMFIYGGEGQRYNLLSDVGVYSWEAEQWLRLRTIHPTPPPRMLHAAVSVGDRMYVVGGRGREALRDVWCFEARTSSWAEVNWRSPASPFLMPDGSSCELYGHTAVAYNHNIVVHGGKLGDHLNLMTWVLDTRAMTWHALERPAPDSVAPLPRWKHCATTIGSMKLTPTMRDFTPLSALNLSDMTEMAHWVQAQKQSLRQQETEPGLLCSVGAHPAISTTDCALYFGGISSTRRLADLWQLQLT